MTSASIAMDRLAWTVKRRFISLRWTGALGLALLLCALALYVFGIAPAGERLAQLAAERAKLSARLGSREQPRQPVTQSSQLANFYAFFPPTSAVAQLLESIEGAAQANALLLQKGEYRLIQERQFRLARYQLTFPVRGSYADVRGFVNDVLQAVPGAALEDLTLKREQIGDPQIEARVRFTLYLGTQ